MADLETCPEHGDTLRHYEDVYRYAAGESNWYNPDDPREHLICGVTDCGYEVWA